MDSMHLPFRLEPGEDPMLLHTYYVKSPVIVLRIIVQERKGNVGFIAVGSARSKIDSGYYYGGGMCATGE